jgi:hydroxypyruvate reductase
MHRRDLLPRTFDAAVAAANPALALPASLPEKPVGRCIVVGAGKATAAMAAAIETAWPDIELSGCVVVPFGYGWECQHVRIRETGHPVTAIGPLGEWRDDQ